MTTSPPTDTLPRALVGMPRCPQGSGAFFMADDEDWGRTLFSKIVLPQPPSRKNFDLIESLSAAFPVAVSGTMPVGMCSKRRVRQAMDAL